jgi:soluble lytic murein transglycosylase-like protein
MESPAQLVILGAVVGFVAWQLRRRSLAVTVGDEEADILTDTVEDLKQTLVMGAGWPTGSAPFADTIEQAAADNDVPVQILAWLLWKESRYNPAIIDGTKRSQVGAMGIAQFMPGTAVDELGSAAAALVPDRAIPGAARYLAKLYRATGSWAEALAAYNWGIGNVQRKGIASAPPETVDYFTTILAKAGYEATA